MLVGLTMVLLPQLLRHCYQRHEQPSVARKFLMCKCSNALRVHNVSCLDTVFRNIPVQIFPKLLKCLWLNKYIQFTSS